MKLIVGVNERDVVRYIKSILKIFEYYFPIALLKDSK